MHFTLSQLVNAILNRVTTTNFNNALVDRIAWKRIGVFLNRPALQ